MLHVRSAADAVPSMGAASERAVILVRVAADEAPGVDGGPRVLVLGRISMILFDLFCDIEWLLMSLEDNVEARGPPC